MLLSDILEEDHQLSDKGTDDTCKDYVMIDQLYDWDTHTDDVVTKK